MLYRKLSPDGDYLFGQNEKDFYDGTLAVGQAIKTNLLLLKGEWWEDIEKGLPLFQNILGQRNFQNNLNSIDLIIQNQILSTKDVVSVSDFSSDYDINTRQYSFACTCQSKYGDVIVNEVIF